MSRSTRARTAVCSEAGRAAMKLVEKTRRGSRVRKRYDRPRTPYARVLEADSVPQEAKEELQRLYSMLNPVTLRRELSRLEDRLDAAVRAKGRMREEAALEYIPT